MSSSWLNGKEVWDGVAAAMSDVGEISPGREKGGDDASWADVNLTEPKNKENPCGRFNNYKWMVKI
jgi:hypothetical protein